MNSYDLVLLMHKMMGGMFWLIIQTNMSSTTSYTWLVVHCHDSIIQPTCAQPLIFCIIKRLVYAQLFWTFTLQSIYLCLNFMDSYVPVYLFPPTFMTFQCACVVQEAS